MSVLSSIPTPVWFAGWAILGLYLGRMHTAWSVALAVPLTGLMLLLHAGLGRKPSPAQAGAYRLRTLTGTEYTWVLGLAVLVVAVTITSTLTRATMGTPVTLPDYTQSLQASPGLMVLFAPVACEILFRGWLLSRLRRPDGSISWTAILVSAFVFAVAARALSLIGAFGALPAAFALGLSAALLLVKTGSLWAPLLLHVLHNGVLMLVAWSGQHRLAPLLTGERPVALGSAVVAEAVAVLAWASVLHFLWKRSTPAAVSERRAASAIAPETP